MPDGTTKQINPFTDLEVWTIPGRKHKPITNAKPMYRQKISSVPQEKENFCNFCEAKYFNTPPEKGRLVRENGQYKIMSRLDSDQVFSQSADFRRIPNLFEIVTTDYWRKNYNFQLQGENKEWKERYISKKEGLDDGIEPSFNRLKDELQQQKIQELDKNQDRIKEKLSDEIVNRYYYKKGEYINHIAHSPYIKKAISILEDENGYRRILMNEKH